MTREEIFEYHWKGIKKMNEVGYEEYIKPLPDEVEKLF